MRSGDAVFDVRPDSLVLTAPHQQQAFDIPVSGTHWALLVEARQAGSKRLALARHRQLSPVQAIEARSRLERIHEDHQRGGGIADHPADFAASAGAQAFLCWVAAGDVADGDDRNPRQKAALRKAEDLLANPTCAKVPIAEIAERAGMSQNRLAIAFRARHGMTMARYRSRALIAFVQQWLTSTDASMATIARQIELPDAQRFNKFFRWEVGMSPSAWRSAKPPLVTSAARPAIDIADPPVAPPARR